MDKQTSIKVKKLKEWIEILENQRQDCKAIEIALQLLAGKLCDNCRSELNKIDSEQTRELCKIENVVNEMIEDVGLYLLPQKIMKLPIEKRREILEKAALKAEEAALDIGIN